MIVGKNIHGSKVLNTKRNIQIFPDISESMKDSSVGLYFNEMPDKAPLGSIAVMREEEVVKLEDYYNNYSNAQDNNSGIVDDGGLSDDMNPGQGNGGGILLQAIERPGGGTVQRFEPIDGEYDIVVKLNLYPAGAPDPSDELGIRDSDTAGDNSGGMLPLLQGGLVQNPTTMLEPANGIQNDGIQIQRTIPNGEYLIAVGVPNRETNMLAQADDNSGDNGNNQGLLPGLLGMTGQGNLSLNDGDGQDDDASGVSIGDNAGQVLPINADTITTITTPEGVSLDKLNPETNLRKVYLTVNDDGISLWEHNALALVDGTTSFGSYTWDEIVGIYFTFDLRTYSNLRSSNANYYLIDNAVMRYLSCTGYNTIRREKVKFYIRQFENDITKEEDVIVSLLDPSLNYTVTTVVESKWKEVVSQDALEAIQNKIPTLETDVDKLNKVVLGKPSVTLDASGENYSITIKSMFGSIWYTTGESIEGMTPQEIMELEDIVEYTGPISMSKEEDFTIYAFAMNDDFTVMSEVITILPPPAAPTFTDMGDGVAVSTTSTDASIVVTYYVSRGMLNGVTETTQTVQNGALIYPASSVPYITAKAVRDGIESETVDYVKGGVRATMTWTQIADGFESEDDQKSIDIWVRKSIGGLGASQRVYLTFYNMLGKNPSSAVRYSNTEIEEFTGPDTLTPPTLIQDSSNALAGYKLYNFYAKDGEILTESPLAASYTASDINVSGSEGYHKIYLGTLCLWDPNNERFYEYPDGDTENPPIYYDNAIITFADNIDDNEVFAGFKGVTVSLLS